MFNNEDSDTICYAFSDAHTDPDNAAPGTQGVLQAHDSIAAKDFTPHLPEVPTEVDEDEETVKIVQLVKSHEPMVSEAPSKYLIILSHKILWPLSGINDKDALLTMK